MIEVEFITKKFIVDKKDYGLLKQRNLGEKTKEGYVLDEYECAYLLEKKKILVKQKNKLLTIKDLLSKKRFNHEEYIVFKDLRSRGYVPKTGLKYGVTFRLYDKEGAKIHAKWLVHVVTEKEKVTYRELSGKNRISHSTKKHLLIAIVDREDSVTYLESNWIRM